MQVPKKIILIGGVTLLAIAAVLLITLRKSGESGKATEDFSTADPEMKTIFQDARPEAEYKETSVDKIDADFAAGKISTEKYALLSITAIYHPENLSDKYRGETNTEADHAFLYGLIHENLDSFSEETKTAVSPFVLPADDPKSYFNETTNNEENRISSQCRIFSARAPIPRNR